ncbi:trimeric LpxA-like protein [Dichotomopilus funicola]|uniref:Dynactin subunit 6 n=1 Tax=Dichotomopilus funicola TaxID=1934379 RepID=A0AAN6ZQA2_9PEZI|nr:trimeric LpxA-like protein [Dichotomopilus funicola]
MSKRHSLHPGSSSNTAAPPKPPVHLSSSLTIADSTLLAGTHTISLHGETVIHPRARIESHLGRVSVGRKCIVHERAVLGAAPVSSSSAAAAVVRRGGGGDGASGGDGAPAGVTLADYVTVEVAAVIEAGETVVGEGTVVGVGSRVGAGAVIGKHCTLTPHSEIAAGEVVPDSTVVYANGMRRTDKRGVAELKNKTMARQIDMLRRMIPSNPAKFA